MLRRRNQSLIDHNQLLGIERCGKSSYCSRQDEAKQLSRLAGKRQFEHSFATCCGLIRAFRQQRVIAGLAQDNDRLQNTLLRAKDTLTQSRSAHEHLVFQFAAAAENAAPA
ncbi:hypothetical protein [Pseudomonas mohnii]